MSEHLLDGVQNQFSTEALRVFHVSLALFLGYSFARLVGNSGFNSRIIAIETRIQNSGLGLLPIFTFFGGVGVMALLAAFWGIRHLVSGLLLASCWGKRPINKNELA